jgi:hypothetical protein
MQNLSTIAFVGALGAVALYVFKVITVKQALIAGVSLGAIGFLAQPSQPGT